MNSSVHKLLQQAKYNDALQILADDDSELAQITRSMIYERIGRYTESLDLAKNVLSTTTDFTLKIRAFVNMAYAYWRLEKYEESLQVIQRGIAEVSDPQDETLRYYSEFYYVRGIIQDHYNNLHNALDDFQTAYQLRLKYEDKSLISHALNALSIVHSGLGELQQSFDYAVRALELKEQIGNPQDIARSYHSMAQLLSVRGEYDDAVHYLQKGIILLENAGSIRDFAGYYSALASLVFEQDKTELAISYAEKAYNLCVEDNYTYGIGSALILLSQFSSDTHTYIQELEKLLQQNKDLESLQFPYQKLLADFESRKSSFASKVNAKQMYLNLLSEPKLRQHIRISVLQQMCELAVEEFRQYPSKELEHELMDILQQLDQCAVESRSFILRMKNLLLRAEISYFIGNLQESRKLFAQAQLLAVEKKFTKLAKYATETYERFFIQKKIEASEFSQTIRNIQNDFQGVDLTNNHEEPVLLLLSNAGGTLKFEHDFNTSNNIKTFLVSSFISALISFSRELFGDQEYTLQRIEHNEYSIYIGFLETHYLIYIFKDGTYHALDHFVKFMQSISEEEEVMQGLNSVFPLQKQTSALLASKILEWFPSAK